MEIDFSRLSLVELINKNTVDEECQQVSSLMLHHNCLSTLPSWLSSAYRNLLTLDLSNNLFEFIPPEVFQLRTLKCLLMKNNRLSFSSLPKCWLNLASSLESLNLSGNLLDNIPLNMFEELLGLRFLYLGDCAIRKLPCSIQNLQQLETLYLGGNCLVEVPAELGNLQQLSCLVLSENRLESLPSSLGQLRKLRSLSLHNNRLQILPPEIVSLDELSELSLRSNPLVVKFVREGMHSWAVPSLMELAGRVIHVHNLTYNEPGQLPRHLCRYLDSAQRCVNPACCGVYFASRVEQVKFVDFCGKYRLPLLQYLCSPNCTDYTSASNFSSSSDETSDDESERRLRRVLLG